MTEDRRRHFTRLYEQYLASTVDAHISPTDTMANEWYMAVGESAAAAVYAACLSSWVQRVDAVLDLPCGHGRVLRHLMKLFPEARFDACDLDRDGVDFCARRFGATPLYSREDLTELDPGNRYDLIWVGSLFTHPSHARTRAWLAHLAGFLSGTGIIVATFHGWSSAGKGLEFGYIDETRWRELVREWEATGYGYRDYPPTAATITSKGRTASRSRAQRRSSRTRWQSRASESPLTPSAAGRDTRMSWWSAGRT